MSDNTCGNLLSNIINLLCALAVVIPGVVILSNTDLMSDDLVFVWVALCISQCCVCSIYRFIMYIVRDCCIADDDENSKQLKILESLCNVVGLCVTVTIIVLGAVAYNSVVTDDERLDEFENDYNAVWDYFNVMFFLVIAFVSIMLVIVMCVLGLICMFGFETMKNYGVTVTTESSWWKK